MELWSWKRENLPVTIARFPDSGRGDDLVLTWPAGRIARGILGCDRHGCGHAITCWRHGAIGDRADRRECARRIDRSNRIDLFGPNLFVFALAMLLLGLISFVLRLEKVGYSYACITLAIIVMIPRAETPWIAAAHRFAEVSLGILVALAVVAVWRAERRLVGDTTAE